MKGGASARILAPALEQGDAMKDMLMKYCPELMLVAGAALIRLVAVVLL